MSMRNPWIDALRVVCALGIVWFHSQIPGASLAYAGLIGFALIALYFESGSNFGVSVSPIARARRLLVPWGIWMCVYVLLNIARGRPILPWGQDPLSGMLAGSSIHLWYLPFIFLVLVLLDIVKRTLAPAQLGIVAALAAAVMLASAAQWRGWPIGAPWAQWLHILPAVLIGMLIGLRRTLGRLELPMLAIVGVAIVVSLPVAGVGDAYIIAVIAIAAVLWMSRANPPALLRRIAEIAPFMFGVYLVHPLMLAGIHLVQRPMGITGVLAAFALSLAAVMLAGRLMPQFARVALGVNTPVVKPTTMPG